jgi:trimeric autotransporter adhesin
MTKISNGRMSWGDSGKIEGHKSWEASGSGSVQLHKPATEQDHAVREATGRVATKAMDSFQGIGQNAFGNPASLIQSALTGKGPDMGELMKTAAFNPTELTQDLKLLGGEMSKSPVDTIQNMMFGMPTAVVDTALKGGEQALQQLEDSTGLKKEFKGSVSKQLGDFREYQTRKQLGDMGTFENTTRTKVGSEFDAQGSMKVGIGGAHGQGSFSGSTGASVESHSRADTVLGTATNTTRAQADATYGGQGSFKAGLSGAEAQGSIGARAGVGASTQGRVENALGHVNYEARVAAEVYANADGTAKLDASGLQAKVRGEIGASAVAEAKADFRTAGIKLGGEDLDIRGEGKVRLVAEAKAEGTAEVNATIAPPRANADIKGKAFAGVKAEVEGKIGIGEFATLSGHAGAWAGAGAEGGIKLGYNDGKLSFGFSGGAAVGYGVGAGWGMEVDVKKLANAAIGTGIQAATKGIEYALNPAAMARDAATAVANVDKTIQKAAGAVDKVASTVTKGIGSMLEGVTKGIGSMAQGAAKGAGSTAQGAAQAINNADKATQKAAGAVGSMAQGAVNGFVSSAKDAGKAIDAGKKTVSSAAQSIASGAGSTAQSVGSAAQSVGKSVGSAAQGAGKAVTNAAKQSVSSVAQGAAKGVGSAAQGAANGVSSAAKGAAKGVSSAAKGATQAINNVDKTASAASKGVSSMAQGAAKAINNVVNKFKLW